MHLGEKRITKITAYWGVKSAQDFLNYMEKRVGTEHTLKRIKSPSYFYSMKYGSFKKRVSLYEEYIGSVEVTHRLRISLGGFHWGNVGEIRDFIEYITEYFGGGENAKEAVKQMMRNSLRAFSEAKKAEMEKFVQYLEEYMGDGEKAKEAVQQMMRSNLQAFSTAKKTEVEKTIKYIENIIGKNKVKQKMKRSFQGFTILKQFQLEQLEQEWGRDVLRTILTQYNLKYLSDQILQRQCMRGFQL
ncbi:MAG: hypothetical protein OXM55_03610 [Bdellovibrionales bacterium]|nr:hypothetical protein [Bdellovibrionales bacterium]